MSCSTVIDRIVTESVRVRLVRPIVSSTLFRIEHQIDRVSIGYALGAWAFCNFGADQRHRELQEAVMEVTIEAKLEPQASNFLWQRGRVFLIALEAVQNVKLGSTARDEVGHIWDCYRELYEEIMGRIAFMNLGLAQAMREERKAAFYRSSDCHWGDEA